MTESRSARPPIDAPAAPEGLLASVVISTYNRHDALGPTLAALAEQDTPPELYEVVVVDDGSTDRTREVLAAIQPPYALQLHRIPVNKGVSAGRNVGMLAAKGQHIILLSDDMIVSEDFISAHLRTLAAHPNCWVVGGFKQLDDLTATPFGRYVDALERSFERKRRGPEIEPNLFEMKSPTARNLSLPRADLARVGLFDERFRVGCEDLDLAHRARTVGIRFLYNSAIASVHNDYAADLVRYCRTQERGAIDTVRLCRKYPGLHDQAPVAIANRHIRLSDGAVAIAKKLAKAVLAGARATAALRSAIRLSEHLGLPDPALFRMYKLMTGLAIFRGWRTGLRKPFCADDLQSAAETPEDVHPHDPGVQSPEHPLA